MKIFVYEHVTGGGMLDDPQMGALAPEGDAMLRALVDDLTAIPGIEVTVMRDLRLKDDLPAKVLAVGSGQFDAVFRLAMRECDAAWPIAPEQDGILTRITGEIMACGRTLLGNRLDAVTIATSKHATADVLARAGIPVIPVYRSERELAPGVHEIVVKPDDGAGCQDTHFFDDRAKLREWLSAHPGEKRIFQHYVRGEARSLSLLCCAGKARVLACNRQVVNLEEGAFRFAGVSVNALADSGGRYALLAARIARALPGLWGYCGVDFMETDAGAVVVEVNPRLTTSYVGLRKAIRRNPAQLVLELPGSLEAAQPESRVGAAGTGFTHAG